MYQLQKFNFLVFFILLIAFSCEENQVSPDQEIEEISATIQMDEFKVDQGEIGISISARSLARKGYKPVTAVISLEPVELTEQIVSFDPYNNLANLNFNNEDLSDEMETALKNGVPVEVVVQDETGKSLATKSFPKLSFTPSPAEQEIENEKLPDLLGSVDIREEVLHYIQIITPNNEFFGAPSSESYSESKDMSKPVKVVLKDEFDYSEDYAENYTAFYFYKVPDQQDVYLIYTIKNNKKHFLLVWPNSTAHLTLTNNAWNENYDLETVSQFSNWQFKIQKEGLGLFKIVSMYTNNPLVLTDNENIRLQAGDHTAPMEAAYFRVLAFDIDWDIQPIEAKFMKPIMPPSVTSSAYNSTLRNCSSGELNQTVGETTTLTTTQTIGWEESMSISTTEESYVAVTLSYEAETNFFGLKGTASASFTSDYLYSSTETQSSKNWETKSMEKSVQVSVSREIKVPPKTGISVADIYQQYENVRTPFVQRFRISGKFQANGEDLSGQEILTQFAFNSFTGVVNDVQERFIEVTVRGTSVIDRLIETSTESRDILGACN